MTPVDRFRLKRHRDELLLRRDEEQRAIDYHVELRDDYARRAREITQELEKHQEAEP